MITPLVSVVTKIALEHTDYLGPDLASIAREKADYLGLLKNPEYDLAYSSLEVGASTSAANMPPWV